MSISVLLVNDTLSVIHKLEAMLSAEGVRVVGTSATIAAATADLQRTLPDIVVIDANLGRETGFDLCRSVKIRHPNTFVAMVSYEHSDLTRHIAYHCGSDFFIPKPIAGSTVQAMVSAYQWARRNPRSI